LTSGKGKTNFQILLGSGIAKLVPNYDRNGTASTNASFTGR
jgi:hypothetical protein